MWATTVAPAVTIRRTMPEPMFPPAPVTRITRPDRPIISEGGGRPLKTALPHASVTAGRIGSLT